MPTMPAPAPTCIEVHVEITKYQNNQVSIVQNYKFPEWITLIQRKNQNKGQRHIWVSIRDIFDMLAKLHTDQSKLYPIVNPTC